MKTIKLKSNTDFIQGCGAIYSNPEELIKVVCFYAWALVAIKISIY